MLYLINSIIIKLIKLRIVLFWQLIVNNRLGYALKFNSVRDYLESDYNWLIIKINKISLFFNENNFDSS